MRPGDSPKRPEGRPLGSAGTCPRWVLQPGGRRARRGASPPSLLCILGWLRGKKKKYISGICNAKAALLM